MNARTVALALCLVTAACGQKADDGSATTATGEVLPGSISDSMIASDTSTASPPMAPVRVDTGRKPAPATSDEGEKEAAASPPLPAAEPAESPDTQ